MTTVIKVISSDLDGKQLRAERARSKYHLRCDGKDDNDQINEAISDQRVGNIFALVEGAWERIFGRK